MTFMAYIRRIMSVCLLVFMVLFGTAFINNHQTQALAKSSQGDSSVAAYRRLQQATYDYRGQMQAESKPDQRAGRAITEKMNQRTPLSDRTESAQQGGKNWVKNAKQSMRQAADTAREKLSSN